MLDGPRSPFAIAFCALSCALGWVTAAAGTIEVTVRDDGGNPVAQQPLSLHPLVGGAGGARRGMARRGMTNAIGQAVFADLPPGQYEVRVSRSADPGLVSPRDNPLADSPVATLARREDHVVIAVTLPRGVPVVCRMNVDRGETGPAKVTFRELDRQTTVEMILRDGRDNERLLVPGRWEAVLHAPQGHLLVDLEVDGRSVAGAIATLDLHAGDRQHFVTWQLSAPARVTGSLDFDGERFLVLISASLVEPGPWIEAARRRGGSRFRGVRVGPDRNGDYEMVLPDGRWKLRPVGEGLESSEPEVAEVLLRPGDRQVVDFTVRGSRPDSGSLLLVDVVAPNRRRIADAVIEVWPLDPADRDALPAAKGRSRGYRPERIRDLDPGDYLVVAGHRDHVEGSFELLGFAPDPESPPRVSVQLQSGGTVHVAVRDVEDAAVPGVQLMLQRTDEGSETLIRDPGLRAEKLNAEARSDETGHAWLKGLPPGPYTLRGELSGERTEYGFVRFLKPETRGRSEPALALDVRENGQADVEAVVVPAASVTATLACDDGGELPASTSIVVLSAAAPGEFEEEAWSDQPTELALESFVLGGERRDTLAVGPLRTGDYHLGVRPRGFTRWTWALGTERRDEASTVRATAGESLDLGGLVVDCAPTIEIRPVGVPGDPLPDLRELGLRQDSVELLGTVSRGDVVEPLRWAPFEANPDRLTLRDLPEGVAQLEIAISHRYFLPGADWVIPVSGPLQRGRALVATPAIPAIGGMVRVRSEQGVAARLAGEPLDEARIVPLLDGQAGFPNLPPGDYVLEVCEDAACAVPSRSWDDLRVEPATTTERP